MGSHMTIDHLEQAIASINHHVNASSTFEFMTHPGYCTSPGHGGCGNGADDFSQSKDREHEMDFLRGSAWKQVLCKNRIEVCSYQDFKVNLGSL